MKEKIYKYLVGIWCPTFNQSIYILDTLNSFVIQETNFPFIAMVVDDASTDGEQEVIRKFVSEQFDLDDTNVAYEKETDYAHITYAQHKTNKNCYIVVLYLKENHYSQRKPKVPYLSEWRDYIKYEAPCEGDDYWIHPKKLQQQADFMEKNLNATLCFHAHTIINATTGNIFKIHQYSENIMDVPKKDMILGGGGFMATNSMFYRVDSIKNYPSWTSLSLVGDAPLMMVLLHRGNVIYINENMSVYRQNAIGSWSSKNISNFKRVQTNHYATIKTWKEFDKWSNNEYHSEIKKKLLKNKIAYYKCYIKYICDKIGINIPHFH